MAEIVDESFKSFSKEPFLYTLSSLPLELIVYIFSFITNARDKVKLRYVSQRLRVAVETPSLWRKFTWSNFDFREERSVISLFESCGRHVKQLSFPDLVIPVELLQLCSNVLWLSLPSVELSLGQLRIIMQSMKKLKYLDILWTTKIDIKRFLLLTQYPVYGQTIQELTIREQLKDSSFHGAFCLALDEWTALKLRPLTLNIVTKAIKSVIPALKQWIPTWNCKSISAHHHGLIKVYSNFNFLVGWIPTFPTYQFFFSQQNLLFLFVFSTDYGMLGLPTISYFTTILLPMVIKKLRYIRV